MPRTRVLAACVVAVFLLSAGPRPSAQLVPPPDVVAIDLNNNHVVVPVEWGGARTWFVLDTGAPRTFVDLTRARQLGLSERSGLNATGAGAGSTAGAVLATSTVVRVPAEPNAVDVSADAAFDMSDLSKHAGREIDGVLGADFIETHVLAIDYEHRQLRLHDEATFQDAGRGMTVPLHFRNRFPMVHAAIRTSATDAFDVDAILDVGATAAVTITTPIVVSHDLVARLRAGPLQTVGRGVGGFTEGRLARLSGLDIGDVRLTNLVTSLAAPNGGVMSTTSLFEANIGGGLMRHFTMVFDYRRSRVTFEPNGAFAEPFDVDMSGLSLTTAGAPFDDVEVEVVRDASPGSAAGFAVGDRIVSIDGRVAGGLGADDAASGPLTLEAIRRMLRVDGRTLTVVVSRDGGTRVLTLTTHRLV
jgi:hypothetical protein